MIHEDSGRSAPSSFVLQAHTKGTSSAHGCHSRAGRGRRQTLLFSSIDRRSRRFALGSHGDDILIGRDTLQQKAHNFSRSRNLKQFGGGRGKHQHFRNAPFESESCGKRIVPPKGLWPTMKQLYKWPEMIKRDE